jgi:hypothetical protein
MAIETFIASPESKESRRKRQGAPLLLGSLWCVGTTNGFGGEVTAQLFHDVHERLAAMYRRSMDDPHLMNMRSEIALLDARLYELAEKFQVVGAFVEGEMRDARAEIITTI